MRQALAVMVALCLAGHPATARAGGKGRPQAAKPHHASAPKVHMPSPPKVHVSAPPRPHMPAALPAHHQGNTAVAHHASTNTHCRGVELVAGEWIEHPGILGPEFQRGYHHSGSYQQRRGYGSSYHHYYAPHRYSYRNSTAPMSAQRRHLQAIIRDLDALASNSASASSLASPSPHTRHIPLHRDLMASVHNGYRPNSDEVEQLTRSIARAMAARRPGTINTAGLALDLMEVMNARNLSVHEVRIKTMSAHSILRQGGVQVAEASGVLAHLRNIGLGSHGALPPGRFS